MEDPQQKNGKVKNFQEWVAFEFFSKGVKIKATHALEGSDILEIVYGPGVGIYDIKKKN